MLYLLHVVYVLRYDPAALVDTKVCRQIKKKDKYSGTSEGTNVYEHTYGKRRINGRTHMYKMKSPLTLKCTNTLHRRRRAVKLKQDKNKQDINAFPEIMTALKYKNRRQIL